MVKREVMASSIEQALVASGTVYAVEMAGEQFQPSEDKPIGFTDKK